MDEEKTGPIGVGSMFKTSEGWWQLLSSAGLLEGMKSADNPWTQAACALGIAIVTSTYIWCRTMAKKDAA
jgi:hypothetical protein